MRPPTTESHSPHPRIMKQLWTVIMPTLLFCAPTPLHASRLPAEHVAAVDTGIAMTAEGQLHHAVSYSETIARELHRAGYFYATTCTDSSQDTCSGVFRDSVFAAFARVKVKLLETLGEGPELAPIRGYVDSLFPTPELDNDYGRWGGSLTTDSSAASAWTGLMSWLRKLRETGEALRVEITLDIQPRGARVEMSPLGGGTTATGVANGSMGILYRGLYRFVVSKRGYPPERGELNLVDHPGTRLVCRMEVDPRSAAYRPCALASTP